MVVDPGEIVGAGHVIIMGRSVLPVTLSTDVMERFIFSVHRCARNPARLDFYEIRIIIIRTARRSFDEPFAGDLHQFFNLTQSDLERSLLPGKMFANG
jgi:hypothetical protein